MMAALAVAFVAYAPAHLARGICSGTGRFRDYAVIMGSDGVVRIVLCVVLAAIGVTAAGPYGFAVGLAPLFAVGLVAVRGHLKTQPGPESSWNEVTPNLGWLLIGSVFGAALLNAGVVAATLLADDEEAELVTQFAYGVLLARIPLFMFQAVQAALLPRLSRLAARNELVEFRSGLRALMLIVIAVGVVGTTGAFLLGPFVIEQFYDAELSGRTLAMLALSSAVLHAGAGDGAGGDRPPRPRPRGARVGHRLRRRSCSRRGSPATSCSAGSRSRCVASSIASMIAFGVALRAKLATGVVPSGASMMDAITDMPLET